MRIPPSGWSICARARRAEVLLIERHQLMGRGIGWVDVHLLASAKLSGCHLWTLDRRLAVIAREQGVMGS